MTDILHYGLGKIGAPAAVARAYIETMKTDLIGQDALAIEKCYGDLPTALGIAE